jgi:predicted porin
MKNTIRALVIPMLFTVGSANAFELYNDDTNSVTMSGWLGFATVNDTHETSVVNDLSQMRFNFERQERNGWTAFARSEWGINLVTSENSLTLDSDGKLAAAKSEDFINNRLGFVGMTNDKWGSLTFGKQWGAYYDVAGTTDLPNVFAGYSVGAYALGDGGITGTGRADSAFQYRNDFGPLNIVLQYAALANGTFENENDKLSIDNSYGAAATYHLTDKLSLLAGFNRGDITGHIGADNIDATNKIVGIGAMYGEYYHYADGHEAKGLYVGFNAHKSENNEQVNGDFYDSTGAELMVAYQYENGFVPMFVLTYQDLNTDETTAIKGDWTRQFAMIGVHYRYSNYTVMFAEAKLDYSSMDDATQEAGEDNGFAVGINYFF